MIRNLQQQFLHYAREEKFVDADASVIVAVKIFVLAVYNVYGRPILNRL